MYHEEPIYRDGELVGSTTSGAWGHRIGKSIGMGYVKHEDGVTKDWIDAGKWESRSRGSAIRRRSSLPRNMTRRTNASGADMPCPVAP
jgi:glycine cleavage system aminomethyltransferase T